MGFHWGLHVVRSGPGHCHLTARLLTCPPSLLVLALTHSRWSREDPAAPPAAQLIPTISPPPPSHTALLPPEPLQHPGSAAAPAPLLGHSKSLCLHTQRLATSARGSGPVMGEGQLWDPTSSPDLTPGMGHASILCSQSPNPEKGPLILPFL